MEEWSLFDREIISAAVTQWRAHLCACVKADGRHLVNAYRTIDE